MKQRKKSPLLYLCPNCRRWQRQRRAIEERQAALYAGEIAIPAAVVDEVLRSGGNRDRSQLRLIYNFMTDPTPEEAAEFVKREYGVGGKGFVHRRPGLCGLVG